MLDKVQMALSKSFEGYTTKDYIRLVIIICAYVLLRNQYTRWRNHLEEKRQVAESKRKEEENVEETFKAERAKLDGKLDDRAQEASTGFGWGNNAKQRVYKRRKQFESQIRRQAEMAQDDSDEEIADLLKD